MIRDIGLLGTLPADNIRDNNKESTDIIKQLPTPIVVSFSGRGTSTTRTKVRYVDLAFSSGSLVIVLIVRLGNHFCSWGVTSVTAKLNLAPEPSARTRNLLPKRTSLAASYGVCASLCCTHHAVTPRNIRSITIDQYWHAPACSVEVNPIGLYPEF
ncbi:hypothetical protein KCU77_g49, partial [Aureobasidium melanogenum]